MVRAIDGREALQYGASLLLAARRAKLRGDLRIAGLEHPDERTRRHIKRVVTHMLNFLLRNGWNVVMPDGQISTTFIGRADQQLSFLQVGRRVNPERFAAIYAAHRAALAAIDPCCYSAITRERRWSIVHWQY